MSISIPLKKTFKNSQILKQDQLKLNFDFNLNLNMNMHLNINLPKRVRRKAHNSSILFPNLSQAASMKRKSKKYRTLATNRENYEIKQLKQQQSIFQDQIYLQKFKMPNQIPKNKIKNMKKNKILNQKSKISTIRNSMKNTNILSKETPVLSKQTSISINDNQISEIAKQFIQSSSYLNKNPITQINRIQQIFYYMEKNFYNYQQIESQLKLLNIIVDEMKSSIILLKILMFSASVMNQYYSYSLSFFYLDKAMKYLTQRYPIKYNQQKNMELKIFKDVSRLFLNKGYRQDARQCAYIYLRKLWKYKRLQEELCAYDFVGQIQNELGNLTLGKLFHKKMCQGKHQENNIIKLSNFSFAKSDKERLQKSSSETINQMIQFEKNFNTFLRDHYKSQLYRQQQEIIQLESKMRIKIPKIVLAHKNPNRLTKNYHQLERSLGKERPSKQIHFVTHIEVQRLKSILTEYIIFFNTLKINILSLQTKNRYSLPLKF